MWPWPAAHLRTLVKEAQSSVFGTQRVILSMQCPKVVQCQAQNSALVQFGCRRAIGQDFGDLQDGRVESVPTTTLHMVVVLATAADHLECSATVEAVAVEDVETVDLVGRLASFARRSC